MAPLNIAISGAGVSGNAIAVWLTRLGHNVTVLERHPALRTSGLQIDLRGAGVEALRRMGLAPEYRSMRVPEAGVEFRGRNGKRWGQFPASTKKDGFVTDWEIMRGDFCKLLFEHAGDARYLFNTSITEFENQQDGVEVKLSNGDVEKFDLVIGADGQGSRTRRQLVPEAPDAFHSLKLYVAYFTGGWEVSEKPTYNSIMYFSTQGRNLMVRRKNAHVAQVYMGANQPTAELLNANRDNVQDQKDMLAKIYHDAGWETERIIEMMQKSNDFYLETLGQVRLDAWSRGRVVLAGDAAYCPSALTGMGTTAALVGAYVLAGEISQHCSGPKKDIAAALAGYEEKLRPWILNIQGDLLKDPKISQRMPDSWLGITVMNLALGVASLFRIDITSWFAIREVEFDLPEYEGLKGVEVTV